MKSGLVIVVLSATMLIVMKVSSENKSSKQQQLPNTIHKMAIGEVFEKHIGSLTNCALRHVIGYPEVSGSTLLLSVKIVGRGRVSDVKLLTKEHEGTFVYKCAVKVLRQMKFPKFRGDPILIPRIPLKVPERNTTCKPDVFSVKDLCPTDSSEMPVPPCEYLHPIRSSDVLAVMRTRISEFKECLREHITNESVRGRMIVKFVINPNGRVSKVRISTPPFRGTIVGRCISKIIKKLEFPEFKGIPKEVDFPFTVK